MQTNLPLAYLNTNEGQVADKILRACVHCGFCTATCPTFLLTANELDSPRGRIYLIKEVLEEGACSEITQTHLDRCLNCQSCETTCPSNVQFHTLLSIGRKHVDAKVGRSLWQQLKRFCIRKLFVHANIFKIILNLGYVCRAFLPTPIKSLIPARIQTRSWPVVQSERKVILLKGCVQQGLSPQTNESSARVLAALGIQSIALDREGCCGALSYHLDALDEGLQQARHNIDLLFQSIEEGVEAIISTASGCGNFVKEYAELLAHDDNYREKALRVTQHCKDISEFLDAEDLSPLIRILILKKQPKLAFHCPCSLQHGQQLLGIPEKILASLGFKLTQVAEQHLCCGSAGTYSLLQPKFSKQLQENKIQVLEADSPEVIATANIGCQNHLSAVSTKPVKHWIEYIDEGLSYE